MSTQPSQQPCTALEKMDHGTQHKLVLIVAPQGTGKERLIQHWVHNWPNSAMFPPSWFFIDFEDNHPLRFLSKLISKLSIWDPIFEDYVDIQFAYDQLLSENNSSELRTIPDIHQKIDSLLDAIINKLMLLEGERFLIMLNYHLIDDPAIHKFVAYFIDYLPPHIHVIISSQVTPPLQIPRLRARRELLEIGLTEMQQ